MLITLLTLLDRRCSLSEPGAAAWVACTLTESNVVVVISAAHASDGAQSTAAMAQLKRWKGRKDCMVGLA
ncbi:hypothetical protein OM948_04350 [Xanthomonas citri pv. fuscans]|uniref:hypothetical protein n=1 Tax=Xanthomonas citri TaxID=346 RepID=UPI002225E067|nr:hypothetical protein [Xanthomonas citri]UZB06148.1 hypothetical protein OM948_04350 [Xanthomonas citri pv. fuscans]